MSQIVLAPSNNRSILGCMRDAEVALDLMAHSEKCCSIDELEMHLTEHIHKPKGSPVYQHPGELAVALVTAAVRGPR